jgi:short-subunit dehydrogenase
MQTTTTIEINDSRQSLLEKFLFPGRKMNLEKLRSALTGKTILITGASYGIGALLVEMLSEIDARLVLVARTKEKLEAIQAIYKDKPCTIIIYAVDLREETEVDALISHIKRDLPVIDLLINNAGKSIHRGLTASLGRYHDTRRCSATNYTGPVQLLMGLLPGILKAKGHIVNVSAQNVLLPPTAGWSAYQSSKAAFDQWLRCMEPELRVNGVMVSSIYLPLVRTRMSEVNTRNDKMPMMSRDKAARIILNCVICRKRKYRPWWTGFPVFFANLFPNGWYRLQVRHHKKKS